MYADRLPRQITLVRCRGAKSLVYDLITDQGVVSSRAVLLYCDLLRLSLDWALCCCLGHHYLVLLLAGTWCFRARAFSHPPAPPPLYFSPIFSPSPPFPPSSSLLFPPTPGALGRSVRWVGLGWGYVLAVHILRSSEKIPWLGRFLHHFCLRGRFFFFFFLARHFRARDPSVKKNDQIDAKSAQSLAISRVFASVESAESVRWQG